MRPAPVPTPLRGARAAGLREGAWAVMALVVAGCAATGPPRPSATTGHQVTGAGHVARASSAAAARLPAAAGVEVPPGFRAQVYARGLVRPTAMAIGPGGRLFVAEASGAVVAVPEGSRRPVRFAVGFPSPRGLAWVGRTLYVSARGEVDRVRLAHGRPTVRRRLVGGLPHGLHQQDAIVPGPGGRLYVGSGSTCNACREPDPYAASVLSLLPSGRDLTAVATGLDNAAGLAVQPRTGRLYAAVDGRLRLGSAADPEPADMLVRILPGGWYGWPGCWPDARLLVMRGACRGVTTPAAFLGPHAGVAGIAFYTGRSFPPGYRGNLFVAEWGLAHSAAGPGRRVVRIVLGRDGTAPISDVSVFALGLQHPVAVAVDPRGALLLLDGGRGIVYRIQADGTP
ncbi:MAG TPA: PQQ-dependent sugar dehydrogenase [Candidatus Micrarchaeia archaeon]|nr:PQQ-dependent sugar dehydrogenase [Candidatus Micrarchaeia archaeon]